MSITNRIKKIEQQTKSTNEHCQCFPMVRTESYEQHYYDSEPQLIGEPVPDICLTCGKKIEKQVIILEFVNNPQKTL